MPQYEISIRNRRRLDSEPYSAIATMPLATFSGAGAERDIEVIKVELLSDPFAGEMTWQVDRVDPENSGLDVLTLHFLYMQPGGLSGSQVGARVLVTTAPSAWKPPVNTLQQTTRTWFLHGHYIKAFLDLASSVAWQRGAFTSIRHCDLEMLDAFQAQKGGEAHDPEKRLQIDRLLLPNPPWMKTGAQEVVLFQQPWTYVCQSAGKEPPVRMFITIRSSEFKYDIGPASYRCNLYRVISVYKHADVIVEDLYVRGRAGAGETVDLDFSPHYFMKMRLAVGRASWPVRLQFLPQITDWFALGSHDWPYAGYGFASDAPYRRVENPPPDHPDPSERNAFGWSLDRAKSFRCLHLFKQWGRPAEEVAHETGRRWYDFIYAPAYGEVTSVIS
jgi:hypothetical protein